MKNFIVTILFSLLFTIYSFSQVGVYRTYNDYKEGNLEVYEKYLGAKQILGRFTVTFEDLNGEKVKFVLKDRKIWGYKTPSKVCRVNENGHAFLIFVDGPISVYAPFNSKIYDDSISFSGPIPAMISDGITGEMIRFTKNNLKKMLKEKSQFKALERLKTLKNSGDINVLIGFIKEFNSEKLSK